MEGKKAKKPLSNKSILIVLGIIIVILVLGFATGWGVPSTNVEQVMSECNAACIAQSKERWCAQRAIIEKRKTKATGNCEELISMGYGVGTCEAVTCVEVSDKCVEQDGEEGKAVVCERSKFKKCPEGKTISPEGFVDIISGDMCCKVACVDVEE